jgi:hypothetical protein
MQPVPPDMLHYADSIGAISSGLNSSAAESTEQSFAGDLWADVVSNVELHRDHIERNYLKSKDLSNRRTPGVSRQYRYFVGRYEINFYFLCNKHM